MPSEKREQVDAEIAAIVSRLREEVGHVAAVSQARTLAARADAERMWAVSAEHPLAHAPRRRGRVPAYLVAQMKRVLRKLMRWYVEPVAAQQRAFNLTVLNLVDELAERVETLERERTREGAEQDR